MKIENTFPPFFEKANNIFSLNKDVIFTYGDTIYNPSGAHLPEDVIIHEEVHSRQQEGSPDEWWENYMKNTSFRAHMELEAYRVQYQFLCKSHKDKNQRFKILHQLASLLSGPIHGNMMGMNEAMRQIKIDPQSTTDKTTAPNIIIGTQSHK